jgi:hypothetical protein
MKDGSQPCPLGEKIYKTSNIGESVEKQVGICSFGEKLIQSSQLRTGA